MKLRFTSLFAVALTSFLLAGQGFAQDDALSDSQRIAGTWTMDIEQTLERVEDEAKKEEMQDRMSDVEIQMVFDADGGLDMRRNGESMPGEPTFKLTLQEDSADKYDVEINGPRVLNGTIEFVDLRTILVTPESEESFVLVRDDEPIKLEEAKKFFVGKWVIDEAASKKALEDSDEMEAPESLPNVFVVFGDDDTVELGEEGNNTMEATFSIEEGSDDVDFSIMVEAEQGPGPIALQVEVVSKYQIFVTPEGQGMGLVLRRTAEESDTEEK